MMIESPRSSTGPRNTARRPHRRVIHTAAGIALGLALIAGITGAAPRLRVPRDPVSIQKTLALGPHAGLCEDCHTAHADEVTGGAYPNALMGPDDNTLCLGCHTTEWQGDTFASHGLFLGTAHGSSPQAVWPGPNPPARLESDARGKCLNCHDPHGWSDASGVIPKLALQREENLCFTCHDGSPAAANIQVEFQKPFRHPATNYSGRHSGATEADPTAFGQTPLNRRHSECEDCHNPHVSRADGPFGPGGNDASTATLGVSRVAVLNGAAGSAPVFTFLAGPDTLTAPVAEYQLCFKCHSSWTTQPSGQTDLARVLNPANPSFHPVEGVGRNPGIDPLAFTSGWSASSITRCGDCHGSDNVGPRGPHGSTYPAILRAPYPASSLDRDMTSDELCFTCHDYAVYADRDAPEAVQARSRFNRPGADKGHAKHVGEERVPCYACHVTHGSTTKPYLIATGRNPGVTSYTSTSTGGTCSPTCHGSESYTVNYAR